VASAGDRFMSVEWANQYGNTSNSGQATIGKLAVDPATGTSYWGGSCVGNLVVGNLPPLACGG
jgi:hypothetical protein